MILVLREAEIRLLLDPPACLRAVEDAFTAYAAGRAETPSVIHLNVPEHQGEVHVKAGYLHGGSVWALKAAWGFAGNPALGLAANDGLVLVFDARTGAPTALLFDNGYITDLRTAAAGAIAAKHLARRDVGRVAVIGTGIQAHLQVQMLAQVRRFSEVRVWGRHAERAQEYAQGLSRWPGLPEGCRVSTADSVGGAVEGADVVLTVTASRAPLVRAEWLTPGSLVVAVGADQADKQELDPAVLARADLVVADSLAQCRAIGEIHHALAANALEESRVVELGRITGGLAPGRRQDGQIIVCDLTGLGVQDVAAAAVIVARARAAGVGQGLEI